MHSALLATFFAAAIGGCTTAFVKIQLTNLQFGHWLALYLLFVLYRTKIMIDDLGWYADLKRQAVQPRAVDVFFAVIAWIGWLMMAAVMGESLEYFTGLFTLTLVWSTLWIYVANTGNGTVAPERTQELSYRILRLKDRRHARWCLVNVGVIIGGAFSYSSAIGRESSVVSIIPEWVPIEQTWVAENLFSIAIGIIVIFLLLDLYTSRSSFREALVGGQEI